ncbi:MAG: hypothetical protein GY697_04605 [Desulfobacterales bacterium]|nr:hypothetical protein [Desulfobacterales bacterium]
MANIETIGEEVIYRQNGGEITAWLTDFEEKMELSHSSDPFYKKIFFLAVTVGLLHLGITFLVL